MNSLPFRSYVLPFCFFFIAITLTIHGCDSSPSKPLAERTADRVDWLIANSVHIRSIDPADEDFSDLAPLVKILQDRRVVLLGEPSHGDGATFLAKTRLVKFLHQEMGFDVLAFESGLYDCRESWHQLNKGHAAHTAFSAGVFHIWSLSEQVQPLIDYWGTTVHDARPLELAGFDCQFTGQNSANYLIPDLTRHLTTIGSDIMTDADWPLFRSILNNLVRNNYYNIPPPDAAQQSAFFAMLDKLDGELAGLVDDPDPSETAFWQQLLISTKPQARRMWYVDSGGSPDNSDSPGNLRDRQMGDNLIWLVENCYPGRKVIVWAATFHIARNIQSVELLDWPGVYDDVETMGQVVQDALGSQTYSIGFTACEGEAGTIYYPPRQLGPFLEGSLEDLLHQTELPYLFLDYRGWYCVRRWISRPLVSWPMGYTSARANWTQVIDGLVCTRVMTPSTRTVGTLIHPHRLLPEIRMRQSPYSLQKGFKP